MNKDYEIQDAARAEAVAAEAVAWKTMRNVRWWAAEVEARAEVLDAAARDAAAK